MEVYIYTVSESEICVKGLPTSTGDFSESYIIKNTGSLEILNQKEEHINFESLNAGNILVFDYKGFLTPKSGASLNKGIYNIRLSEEVLNNKFWNIKLENTKGE